MTENSHPRQTIKVAIIGAGPAGLGAAIELGKRSFIDWILYEKKPSISEISSGLTLQPTTWRMLEHMGAAHHIKADDFFRPAGGHVTQHRNGRTGKLLLKNEPLEEEFPHQEACRAHRAVLQQALLKQVNQSWIRVDKKLTSVSRLGSGKLRLSFEGGTTDDVDLLVGADGIRSAVRAFAFPSHRISYTGATAYRTLVRTSDALGINGLPKEVIFWHGTDGKWVYTCPLGANSNDLEITCRVAEPDYPGREGASWGQQASVKKFREAFSEFCPPIRQLLDLATYVEQYDYFAGPRLPTVVAPSVALIGDASHPLSGAFGAGAGFALEDAYALGGALDWAIGSGGGVKEALALLDRVRTPYYNALYGVLDEFGAVAKNLPKGLEPDDEIEKRVRGVWDRRHTWIYYHRVDKALAQAIQESEKVKSPQSVGTAQGRL